MKTKIFSKVLTILVTICIMLSFAIPVRTEAATIVGRTYYRNRIKVFVDEACKIAALRPKKNDLPFVKDLQANWCARFVSYLIGDPNFMYIKQTANSVDMLKWYYNSKIIDGRTSLRYTDPHVGDLIFYDWDKHYDSMDTFQNWEHVGIIARITYDADGNPIFNTVEGNVDGEGWQNTCVRYIVGRNADWEKGDYIAGFASPFNANETITFMLGDLTGDRKIDSNDVAFLSNYLYCINRFSSGIIGNPPFWRWSGTINDKRNFAGIDINNDGHVDNKDLAQLQTYVYCIERIPANGYVARSNILR